MHIQSISLQRLALILSLITALSSTCTAAEPQPAAKVRIVRDYGATGDGKTLDTAAIQKAIDACAKAGGGTVQMTAGTYLCQPITLASKTTLQLDEGAVLLATDQHADFMKTPGEWLTAKSGGDFIPLISGKDLTDVAIKSGKRIEGRAFACEDISITDCTFLHGHGMSIGSETSGGVRNVTVERCTFKGTENGIRIKSPRGKGGTIQGLRCSDITMENVDSAITITCYYPKIPKEDAAQPVTPETPVFKDIVIRNLTATCPKGAGVIVGLPESLVENVTLENVRIQAQTGLVIRNAKAVRLKDVQVEIQKGSPFTVENAAVEGL